MTIAIMQPYFFPYIGYFQLINLADKFIVYDDVTFIKQGWINRNRILVNGKPQMFTVPINSLSSNRLIKDTEMAGYQKWNNKFIKTLHQNYKKAPYFESTMELIRGILESEETHIAKLAVLGIREICRRIGIATEIVDSSTGYNNNHLNGQQRVLDICIREQTSRYINAINGRDLYSKETFEAKGIGLSFLKTGDIVYRQFENEFVPNLSIVDALMFNSVASMKEILSKCELI